jgi:hypothetical protein
MCEIVVDEDRRILGVLMKKDRVLRLNKMFLIVLLWYNNNMRRMHFRDKRLSENEDPLEMHHLLIIIQK